MKRVVGCLFLVVAVCSADILFEDFFDDGNADGWYEECSPPGASFWVESGTYHFAHTGSGVKLALSSNGDDTTFTPHQMSLPDYFVRCKVSALSPTEHLGVLVRFETPILALNGYSLVFNYVSDFVAISKWISGSETFLVSEDDFGLEYGEEYWVRFDCIGDQLLGKVWAGTLADEPVSYLFQTSDSDYTDPGLVCLGGHCWSADFHVAFDSVMVETIPEELDPVTWGAIKSESSFQ